MIYFVYVPNTGKLQSLSETRKSHAIEDIRMTLIHELESCGHSPRYTWFDSSWWTDESMTSRGIINTKIHLLAKNIEELSKCDGIYFGSVDADVDCDYVGSLLKQIAVDYMLDIKFFDNSTIVKQHEK